jgi:acyl-coenzyme A synthetase/AMP-(fatty) acid ligase
MKTPCNRFPSLRNAIKSASIAKPGILIGAEKRVSFSEFPGRSAIHSGVDDLRGRAVLIAVSDPFLLALALTELDGFARRMILCPPDLGFEHLPYVMRHGDVDAVVSDGTFLNGFDLGAIPHVVCQPTLAPRIHDNQDFISTEWILLTSGTTGRPKIVLHTLASLAGAICPSSPQTDVIWSTFYDIRRYGGLQIFLRSVITNSSLLLAGPRESLASFLRRAGEAGVTHISGTPSHWRRALMSPEAARISPKYIRLSGEIADQDVINSLRTFYPNAQICHAFATTEAGVAFEVHDELPGFPASFLSDTCDVDLKVVDKTLRIRSDRTAKRYLGENPPELKDVEGFIDTGDVLELSDGRYYFQGRRDGVINVGGLKVHPEEIEAVLNRHPQVRQSLVKTKKNPMTGALVVADVLLKDPANSLGLRARELQHMIKQFCRASLAPHKVPATISFVGALAVSDAGKLDRHYG